MALSPAARDSGDMPGKRKKSSKSFGRKVRPHGKNERHGKRGKGRSKRMARPS